MKRFQGVAMAALFCSVAAAQSFEVASIHTRTDGTGGEFTLKPFRFEFSGQRLTIENFRLKDLITYAYAVEDYELIGGPRWAAIDRYDISADAAGDKPLTHDLARPLMRSLLADRFRLKVHTEMHKMPVYELIVAKGGPKMRLSSPDAHSLLTLGSAGNRAVMTVIAGSMAQLTGQFSKRNNVDRPVLDKSGLTGLYDYKLEWGNDTAPTADLDSQSIFSALQQQLGLRLKPASARMRVLVVDSAEKPSAN
jgi:uncharacterized protein (TIGR03435 family)